MDTSILKKAGLTESQAKGYIALVKQGKQTAQELADNINESRTNSYAIADKLVAYGLATKSKDARAAKYTAAHPSSIEALAERRRKGMAQNEKAVKDNINYLTDFFYEHTELPGIRLFQGADGVIEIFNDILRDKEDIQIIRSPEASLTETTGDKAIRKNFIAKRVKLGLKAEAITPTPSSSNDESQLYTRHFIGANRYNAPVEINIYGNKVALVSFGQEVMGVIIDSPQIATSFRQMFSIMLAAK